MSDLGQTEKNSLRANVFRCSADNGHPRRACGSASWKRGARFAFHNRPFRENLSHRDTAEMSTLCIFALAPIPIARFVAATAASELRKSQDLVG
jgi:hypothetical protein